MEWEWFWSLLILDLDIDQGYWWNQIKPYDLQLAALLGWDD